MSNFNLGDGSRKVQQELYGTWFSKTGSASYYVNRCVPLIAKYETWLQNLREQLSTQKEELLKVRGEEIRKFLTLYTTEEIAAIQNGSGS